MNINNYVNSQDFHPSMSFSGQEIYPGINSTGFHPHQNPRKKRTKFIRIDGASTSAAAGKPKCSKKPDPTAPKITRPCSECGKKFWSWKALFGHMRCHPERQWRGINPPPNFRRSDTTAAASTDREATASVVTEEDHEVATCLLLLANGSAAISTAAVSESPSVTNNVTGILESDSGGGAVIGAENIRFECSSCKKVFGSHQALGGHRATHKNVKGCYAINKNFETIDDQEEEEGGNGGGGSSGGGGGGGRREHWMSTATQVDQSTDTIGHKCSICLRVFSTGQALGGHKRCHWEKSTEEAKEANCGLDLDLNLHMPDSGRIPVRGPLQAATQVPVLEDDVSSSASFYSGLELDLRLGL